MDNLEHYHPQSLADFAAMDTDSLPENESGELLEMVVREAVELLNSMEQ